MKNPVRVAVPLVALTGAILVSGCTQKREAPATTSETSLKDSSEKPEESRPRGVTTPEVAATAAASGYYAPGAVATAAPNFDPGDGKGATGGAAKMRAPSPRPMMANPHYDNKATATDSLAVAAPTALPKLNPNARYATTYRPGGAALAAFDAAVQKGSIPASYKDLVGDFGGRYAPAMKKPETGALAVQVDAERGAVPPSGGPVNLRISLRSSDKTPGRAPLSVHLVLDVSGSMSGSAIENARDAAAALVNKLEPSDDFSLITFSSDAQVLVPDGAVGPRKADILQKIKGVKADGGTNISAGLDLGYKEAHSPRINPDAVKIVMLLSDGHANAGDSNPRSLSDRSAKAFQDGIQTSSFGLGPDFDASLMSTIADKGAGGYYYLADSTQITPALSHELDARLVPVAQGVEVRLRLRPEVSPIKVFGSHALDAHEAAAVRQQEIAVDKRAEQKDGIKRDRKDDTEGGMRFFMPSFSRDDRHAMLVTVMLPAGVGEKQIASVEVKYKDRLQKKNVTEEIAVKTRYAGSDGESAGTVNASVAATVQAFSAGDTILRAAETLDLGDRASAARLLNERAELLKAASKSLAEPKLDEDAARLMRLAMATSGPSQVSDPLPLAVMLRGSGYGYLR